VLLSGVLIYSYEEQVSSRDEHQLTTTSYAILCLLAIQPWSMYALAKQMRRDLHYVWPRAESNIYVEPKRLVELGLARAEVQQTGKRSRTIYSITQKGRRVLPRWLATESAPSRYESETLLKILYGNYGTKDDLLANLHAFAAEAEQAKAGELKFAEEYTRGEHQVPEPLHLSTLFVRLMFDQAQTRQRWAEWALSQVETWPDAVAGDAEATLETLHSVLLAAGQADR
jgi:PadR family transcriptional regulator, regulatory protein AphA